MTPPGSLLEKEEQCQVLDEEMTAVAEKSAAVTKPWTLAHAILGKHKTLTSSTVTVAPDNSFAHVSVLNVGRAAVLNQWQEGGRDESLVLSRLPHWEGAESARTTVIKPSHESEPIKIVFDKSAATWSKVSSRTASAFPLMVERDVCSFAGQSSTTTQCLLPGDTSGPGVSRSIQYARRESGGQDRQQEQPTLITGLKYTSAVSLPEQEAEGGSYDDEDIQREFSYLRDLI